MTLMQIANTRRRGTDAMSAERQRRESCALSCAARELPDQVPPRQRRRPDDRPARRQTFVG